MTLTRQVTVVGHGAFDNIIVIDFVAGDLMLFELIVVRVHCIVCIVCDWRSHDYLVVRI